MKATVMERDKPATTPTAAGSAAVQVRGLQKTFRRGGGQLVPAIADVTFDLHPGELLVLLGPSGCGKTTLLRSIAGLEKPDSGNITISGKSVFDSEASVNTPPEGRDISMLFQSYALWPHMTVEQNIEYPLRARKIEKSRRSGLINRVLEMGGIGELRKQYPGQLSGGQQQRVALARSLVADPTVVLFDEPLSNIDEKVRQQLRLEIRQLQREIGFAGIYVTHDQNEAMQLADTLVVLDRGAISQAGAPREVYNRPANPYVANFIGSTNVLEGHVASSAADGSPVVVTEIGELTPGATATQFSAGDLVKTIFRPETVRVHSVQPGGAERNVWQGVVDDVMYLGSSSEVMVQVGEHRIQCSLHSEISPQVGATVWLSVSPEGLLVYPAAPKAANDAEVSA